MKRVLTRRDFLRVAGTSVAGAALLGATGCGGGGAGVGGTLKYWSMWNEEEPQQKVLQKTINEFQKANPDITVDVLWGGREILTKVRSALATGTGPDLVDKDAEELVGALVYNDQAMPLDDVVTAQIPGEGKTIGEVVPETYLDLLAYEGNRYLIPYEALTSGIWYNGTQFQELGVSPPATWDELFEVNEQIKSQGVSPFTVDGNVPFYNAYYFYWLAERYAGPGAFADAAGDKSGKAWDSPELLEAARSVEEFVDSGALAPGYEGNKWPSAQNAWAQGKAAMYLCGSWLPSETAPQAPENMEYRMLPFPRVPNGEDSVELYLIGWVVPKVAENPEAAKKFISFAMNKQRLQGIVDTAQNMTPRPDMSAPPNLRDAKKLLDSGKPFHRVYDGIQALQPGWWEQVFLPIDDKLFFGELGGEEFVSQVKEETVKYWEKDS
jgi:ABC-type glycerol-3-phosphate transport system substrate-binding protein